MILQTAQKRKSEETVRKIYTATKTILQQYGNDVLTIRNICDVAGVSTGSFYHHFHNKEELMRRYIIDAYQQYREETPLGYPQDITPILLDELTHCYYRFTHFCIHMGKPFVRQNIIGSNLDILRDPSFDADLLPVLERIQAENCLQKMVRIPTLLDDLSIIETGLLVRWCYNDDTFDLIKTAVRLLWIHLSSLVTDEYVQKHKDRFSGRFSG